MFHILHVGKNMVCIQYRMHCAGSKLFITAAISKKKRIFTKKGGDIPEKHPLPSRAALSVISFFLHQLIVQFTCMA
jgi:hypothetical protein